MPANLRYEEYNDDEPRHQLAAEALEIWSAQAPMNPLSRGRLRGFDYSMLAYDRTGVLLLGHMAVEEELFVGFVANPLFARGRIDEASIGDMMLDHAADDIPRALPGLRSLRAHANVRSLAVFQRHGGVLLGEREEEVPTGCIFRVDLMPMLRGVPIAGIRV